MDDFRLSFTAGGLHNAQIKGSLIGDAVFAPGFTRYDKGPQVQWQQVSDMQPEGANPIGFCIGDGWQRGPLDALRKPAHLVQWRRQAI